MEYVLDTATTSFETSITAATVVQQSATEGGREGERERERVVCEILLYCVNMLHIIVLG